jgi:hypothetical protein
LVNDFSATNVKALLAPLYWRLLRCSDSDVTQLNFLYDKKMRDIGAYPYKTAAQSVAGGTVNGSPFPSEGYALSIVNADCYSQGDANGGWVLSLNDINLLHTKATSIEGPEIFVAASRDISGWPLARGNAISRNYYQGSATVPERTAKVHLIVGTLDHNTPIGQSDWIRHEYGNNVDSKLYIVPYATHGVVDQYFHLGNTCAAHFVQSLLRLDANANPGNCLSDGVPAPDWEGTTSATEDTSSVYFGTTDLWNNNGIPVTGPTPSPGPLGGPIFAPTAAPAACTCPSCVCDEADPAVLDATLGLVATIFVMVIGLYIVIFLRGGAPPLSKQGGSSGL